MKGGWFRLHRSIFDSPEMKNKILFYVFVWCCSEANIDDDRARGLKRGQFRTTSEHGAYECDCSRSAWNRAIERLTALGNIKVETDTRGTTITVCNYETYQPLSPNSEQRADNKKDNERTTGGQLPLEKEELEERKEGGAAQKNSSSATASPVAKDAANDDDSPIAQLARDLAAKWCFHRRGTKGRDELERASEVFEEMMRHGITGAAIEAEIVRKDRRRTEPLWEFENRMLRESGIGRNGSTGVNSPLFDAAKATADYARNRGRAS